MSSRLVQMSLSSLAACFVCSRSSAVRRAVVFLCCRTHVSPRRQDVVVLADLVERGGLAKARNVYVLSRLLFPSPGMVSPRNTRNLLVRQLAMSAIHHAAHLPGIDEKHMPATIPEAAVLLIARQKPEASRNLGGIEELARQSDHAVDQIGFDNSLANLALSRLIRRH